MSRAAVSWPAWRVLVPIGLGTALSLLGDAALYVVLPIHAAEAGVLMASVGLLLSANRWIRLVTNGAAGWAYDRWPRRWLFLPALFLGALSTALYAWTDGFWPLLAGRLLWGLAWSGIWVGGNRIVLDVATDSNRGRWTGFYQLSFYLGSTLGFPLGGLLTDRLGYHPALLVAACLTFLGAVAAALWLPETRLPNSPPALKSKSVAPPEPAENGLPRREARPLLADPLVGATAVYGVNSFVATGVLSATLGLLVQQRWGEAVAFGGGLTVGVATLTGALLGVSMAISMLTAPLAGHWSDRRASRWRAVSLGLVPGVVGFGLLALAAPAGWVVAGVLLTAIAAGSNQSLATAVLGDEARAEHQGRALGWMHTFGDLCSAIAPPLTYAVLPVFGLSGVYGVCSLLLFLVAVWSVRLARLPRL